MTHAKIGVVLSIHVTTAVVLPVFPAKSLNVNTNEPLPVKVYPVAFIHVNVSLYHVKVATTFPLVVEPDHGT